MRLLGIKNIEEANAYAPKFMEIYNNKFSKKPKSDFNAHRSLEGSISIGFYAPTKNVTRVMVLHSNIRTGGSKFKG